MKAFMLASIFLAVSLALPAQTGKPEYIFSGPGKHIAIDDESDPLITVELFSPGEMVLTMTGDVGEILIYTTTPVQGQTADNNGRIILWKGRQESGKMTSTFKGMVATDFVARPNETIVFPFTGDNPPKAYRVFVRTENNEYEAVIPERRVMN